MGKTRTANEDGGLAELPPAPDLCVTALKQRREQQEAHRQNAGTLRQHTRGLIFTSRYGTPVEPGNLTRAFAARIDQADVHAIPLRNPRHTTGKLLIAQGVHPKSRNGSCATPSSR
jgi:hypothetical protein